MISTHKFYLITSLVCNPVKLGISANHTGKTEFVILFFSGWQYGLYGLYFRVAGQTSLRSLVKNFESTTSKNTNLNNFDIFISSCPGLVQLGGVIQGFPGRAH